MMKPFVCIVLLFAALSALSAPAQSGHFLNEARVLLLRGPESLGQGRQMVEKTISLYAGQGKKAEEFAARRLLAITYNADRRHDESKRSAQYVLEEARRLKSRFWEVSALSLMAFADFNARNLEQAFLFAQQAYDAQSEPAWQTDPLAPVEAQRLERVFTNFLMGALYNQLLDQPHKGQVFLIEGDAQAAQSPIGDQYYKMEINAARLLVLRELGALNMRLRQHQKSITYLKAALDLMPESTGPIATIHFMLADAYMHTRQPELAEVHAQKSLSLALAGNFQPIVGEAYTRLGHISAALGNDSAAEMYFQKSAAHPQGGRRGGRGSTGLGDVYSRRGKAKDALKQYTKAVELVERQLTQTSDSDSLFVFRQNLEPYMKSLDSALSLYFRPFGKEEKYARQAFQLDQRIRNRMFSERLAAAWKNSGRRREDFDAGVVALDRQMTAISRSLLNDNLATAQRDSMTKTLDRLEIQRSVLRRKIAMYDNVTEDSSHFRDLSIEEIQKLIPPNSALLEYNTAGFPAAFVLTRDQFQVVRFPRPEQLDRRINTYFDVLSKSSGDTFETFGAAGGYDLFTEMVEPVLRALPNTVTHLIISPPPPLEMLPFEALPVNRRGTFLIEKFAVSYLPSASALPIILERRNSGATRELLAFADPAYGSAAKAAATRGLFDDEGLALNALPYAKLEVDSVADIVGREHSDVYAGSDASESQLKRLDLTQYRLLHFATHAIGSRSRPERSALVLSIGPDEEEDGLLQAREIHDLRLNADLVVLSACQTGGVRGAPGEGVQGLSRAFLFAGARSLIASMWKVEDEPTARLMTHFYAHLREGLSKAESLRRAKLDVIRDGYSHPRQWAGFVLFGEANETVQLPQTSGKTNYTYFAIVGLIALLSVTLPAYRILR